ncbi:hypothetical protein ABMY32_10960, partial [Vibrio vulnificus]
MRWFAVVSMLFHFSIFAAQPNAITLVLPTQLDGSHLFYHELLRQSLESIGVKLNIETPYEHIRFCKKCGSPMIIKIASQGEFKGRRFFTCSRQPNCTY